jgi:hypothetical protein
MQASSCMNDMKVLKEFDCVKGEVALLQGNVLWA